MLKLATEDEERFGGVLMEWWDGADHPSARTQLYMHVFCFDVE